MNTIGIFAYGEMGDSVIAALHNHFTISWVILPPKALQTTSEKNTESFAQQLGLKINYSTVQTDIYQFIHSNTPDAVVIGSYNKILPQKILNLTKFINIHLGDLPRFRGRANVNWAIINDRTEIGVAIHEMVPDLDAGNIYKLTMIKITSKDDVQKVYENINNYLKTELSKIVIRVLKGYKGVKQNGKPTYCCTRLPEDGLIDWTQSNKKIYNFIRALTRPYPGAFSYLDGKKIIIWNAEIPKNPKVYEGRIPGRIGSVIKDEGIEVLTGDGQIIIKEVSYDGKVLNASQVIKSVKKTLGINWVEIYERLNKIKV